MTTWTVFERTYTPMWVHPVTWKDTFGGVPSRVDGEGDVTVYMVDDGVPVGDCDSCPPTMAPEEAIRRFVLVLGNTLKSRERIEFLRLSREFPEGMDVAYEAKKEKNPKRYGPPSGQTPVPARRGLLQPGAFPDDPESFTEALTKVDPGDDEAEQGEPDKVRVWDDLNRGIVNGVDLIAAIRDTNPNPLPVNPPLLGGEEEFHQTRVLSIPDHVPEEGVAELVTLDEAKDEFDESRTALTAEIEKAKAQIDAGDFDEVDPMTADSVDNLERKEGGGESAIEPVTIVEAERPE